MMMNAKKDEKPQGGYAAKPQSAIAEPKALLDAFEALSDSASLWGMLQEITNQLVSQTRASGAAILQWDPEADTIHVRAQAPADLARPVGSLADSPEISANAILREALASQAVWQGKLDEFTGLGLEEALNLSVLQGTALLKPLIYRHELRGLSLIWDQDASREFSRNEIIALRVFLRHAAIAFENRVLLQEAQENNQVLEAFRQAALYLTSSLDLDEVLHAILESTLRLLENVLDAHIFLYDGKTLSFGAAMWADGRKGQLWSKPRRGGLTYTVAESGELMVVPDMRKHSLYQNTPQDWNGAIIGAPLCMANRVVGVMNVAYAQPRQFTEQELRRVTLLADQAAIAIHNARLHSVSQEEAHTDPLTNLPNRRAFDLRIEEEIRRSARYGHSFSVIMMDLDGFKRVNDNHGHQMGDVALRDIARCLRLGVRDTDFLARFGGDEFILILPETKIEYAKQIGQKLQDAVKKCDIAWRSNQALSLSLSVGTSTYPDDGEKAARLIRVADKALYEGKTT